MKNYDNNVSVKIPVDSVYLEGILNIPKKSIGIVIFAHGSGSGRLSPRNNYVAEILREAELGTLLFDLLTEGEDQIYQNRFDIDLLAERLKLVTEWVADSVNLKIGYFGASTGSAAAIKAAVEVNGTISAFVSRGGRVDLAAAEISNLKVPALLIVGGNDPEVLELNETAFDKIEADKKLEIISGASHLFEEKGSLEEAARLAKEWFLKYL